MAARVVYKDLAHELRSHGKEVGAVLPLRQILLGQSQICFVHEGCTLQSVIGTFVL